MLRECVRLWNSMSNNFLYYARLTRDISFKLVTAGEAKHNCHLSKKSSNKLFSQKGGH